MEEFKICQNCNFFDQPRCKKFDKFTARKNNCDNFELNKKKKIQPVKQKVESDKKSDDELKKEIFGEKTEIPEKRKFERSKKQRRK